MNREKGDDACHGVQGCMHAHKEAMANSEQLCCTISTCSCCAVCFIVGSLKMPNGGEYNGEPCKEEEPGAVDSDHDRLEAEQ